MLKKILLFSLLVSFSANSFSGEQINNNKWNVKIEKGEIAGLFAKGEAIADILGSFRVAGKKEIRQFSEVSTLREKKENQFIYEGISDDGDFLYAEFGEVIAVDKKTFDFMLYTAWLPPSPMPPDAVEGILKFGKDVEVVKRIELSPEKTLPPNTLAYEITMKSGTKLNLKIIGLDKSKTVLAKEAPSFVINFRGASDYVKEPRNENQRTLSYWISSTDTHYMRFIFSLEGN